MAVETALSLMVLRRPHTRFHAAWSTHTLSSLQALPGAAEAAQLQALIRLAETATAAEMVAMVGDPLSTMAGRLAGVLHSYQQAGLRSIWHRLQEALDAERMLHSRALLNGGPRELLGAIGRGLAWDGSELRVGANPERQRALCRPRVVLMPSAFCREAFTVHDDRQVIVVFPMAEAIQATALTSQAAARAGQLGDLLGHTRAQVLAALGWAQTTTEVALRCQISAATASRHLTILREAGLVTSQRQANEMHHMISALGRAILGGSTASRQPRNETDLTGAGRR